MSIEVRKTVTIPRFGYWLVFAFKMLIYVKCFTDIFTHRTLQLEAAFLIIALRNAETNQRTKEYSKVM